MERIKAEALVPQVSGQADALEVRIKRPLENRVIGQRVEDVIRDLFSAGEVDDLHRAAVYAVAEQDDLEGGRFGVLVDAAFAEIDVAERLQIQGQAVHFSHAKILPVFIALMIDGVTLYIAASSTPLIPQ